MAELEITYNSIKPFFGGHVKRRFVVVIPNVDPGTEQMKHPEKLSQPLSYGRTEIN